MDKEKKLKRLKELAAEINALLLDPSDFEDDRVPCVRINGAGNVEFYNCKTGEVIK